jgi:acyl carrier protein
MSTLARLQALLARDFGFDPDALRPEASLESLEIDSLRMIEILFTVEEEFGIRASGDQAELKARLATLGDLADYVDEIQAGAAGPKA